MENIEEEYVLKGKEISIILPLEVTATKVVIYYLFSSIFIMHQFISVTQSCPALATPWTVAHQAPLSMGFSRQEYWSGWPCPTPWDLPDPGIEPESPAAPALQADSLLMNHGGKTYELCNLWQITYLLWSCFLFVSGNIISMSQNYCIK